MCCDISALTNSSLYAFLHEYLRLQSDLDQRLLVLWRNLLMHVRFTCPAIWDCASALNVCWVAAFAKAIDSGGGNNVLFLGGAEKGRTDARGGWADGVAGGSAALRVQVVWPMGPL